MSECEASDSVKSYSVYRLTNLVNGKLYFGITKRPVSTRMKQHRKFANKGSDFLISRAIRKYGWKNFSVDVLYQGLNVELACALERLLIGKYGTFGDDGYNLTNGGQHGVSFRAETREKKSLAGKRAWENSEAMRNSIHDPERIRKISEASRRNWKNPEYRAKILNNENRMEALKRSARDPEVKRRKLDSMEARGWLVSVRNINNGMVFRSASDAGRWLSENTNYKNAAYTNILKCCKKLRKRAYGYEWEYAEESRAPENNG